MADFLFYRYVSDVLTPLYSCDKTPETLEHVLLHCTEIAGKKEIMRQRVALLHYEYAGI
jgi:hypothetical protein